MLRQFPALRAMAALRVYDHVSDFKQTPLIGVRRDLAAEKSCLTAAGNIRWGESTRRDPEHGQVGLAIADCDGLSVRREDPVAKGNEAGSFINIFGHHGRIDGRVAEGELIEVEVHQELIQNMR